MVNASLGNPRRDFVTPDDLGLTCPPEVWCTCVTLTLVNLRGVPWQPPHFLRQISFIRTTSHGFTQMLPAKDVLSPISDLSAASILLLLRISLSVRYSWAGQQACI